MAGLAAAKRRGRRGGRPVAIGAEKMLAIKSALDGGATKAAVCRTFGVKRSTLIDSLTRTGWSPGSKTLGGKDVEGSNVLGRSDLPPVRPSRLPTRFDPILYVGVV